MGFEIDQNNSSSKCVYIYKNLLRDIKIFFQLRFKEFVAIRMPEYDNMLKIEKESKAYSLLIVLYVQYEFDLNLMNNIREVMGAGDEDKFLLNVAFALGSILDTKAAISSFQSNKQNLRDMTSTRMQEKMVELRQQLRPSILEGDTTELNETFFGLFKNKTIEYKKLKSIEYYRIFFRFSMEKLQLFVQNPFYLSLFF